MRFDYSGHGQSSGSIDKTCFSDWYQDAEYLINKLTKDKQILVGSSMGAWIMLMLAKRIPQKVSAIIGLAPAPDFPKLLIMFLAPVFRFNEVQGPQQEVQGPPVNRKYVQGPQIWSPCTHQRPLHISKRPLHPFLFSGCVALAHGPCTSSCGPCTGPCT